MWEVRPVQLEVPVHSRHGVKYKRLEFTGKGITSKGVLNVGSHGWWLKS